MNAEDEIKDRVERIYSLDGPGFPEEVVKSFEYASVSDRIVKIVPDSSVVGMVFETPERCVVVKSDVDGIMQHFAFSWQMHGGEFAKPKMCRQFGGVQQVAERLACGTFQRTA